MPYIYVAAAAFISTYLCVPLTNRLAHRLGAIVYPSKRRINTKPNPRLGGLAMFAGLCVALIVEIAGIKILGWPPILIPHPSMSISYPILGLSFLVIAPQHEHQLPDPGPVLPRDRDHGRRRRRALAQPAQQTPRTDASATRSWACPSS